MRKIGLIFLCLYLTAVPIDVFGEQTSSPPSTTLQEITHQAEQRLAEWDAEDAQEQNLHGWQWLVAVLDLAVGVTLGHVGTIRAARFSSDAGLTIESR